MDRESLVRELPHVSKLSISDQAKRGPMSRREFLIPESLLPIGIGRVRLPGGSSEVPAAVASRSILTRQIVRGMNDPIEDKWSISYEPYDPNLLRRSLAKAGKIGPTDVPPAMVLGEEWPASSDLTELMRPAHQALSDLRPPFERTFIVVVLWQNRIGGVGIDFVVSSIHDLPRQAERARQHNRLVRATSFPCSSPIIIPYWVPLIGGTSVWGRGELQMIPDVPRQDDWVLANREKIQRIVEMSFKPVLWSLWRAVFAEPPVRDMLRHQKYILRETDRTMMGPEVLSDLMQERAADPANMTALGTPELIQTLMDGFYEPTDE